MIRQHFRRRTPEEDIATFEREAYAYGPLIMAAGNAAAYAIVRPSNPELLYFAASEGALAVSGLAYVNYRFRRGAQLLGNSVEKHRQRLRDRLVEASGMAGFVGAAQSGLASTLDLLHVSESTESISMGAGSAALLGLGASYIKGREAVVPAADEDPCTDVEKT